ncbi:MAG: excinuclease ATPase subunit [Candidatus Rokuibacteriota bacterium]
MNLRTAIITLLVLCAASGSAAARDTRHLLSLGDALNAPEAKEKLDTRVVFYFGTRKHPSVAQRLGEYTANRKTNAFNKSDKEACEWVFLSALLALRDRAVEEGGDAVINIKSFYKKNEFISDTQYECHAGTFVAGVALRGTVVKLAR